DQALEIQPGQQQPMMRTPHPIQPTLTNNHGHLPFFSTLQVIHWLGKVFCLTSLLLQHPLQGG
ncbi:hypothetical protein, partial [Arachnia propionica]|uniref:hypothetical protein n=1 Tax=Arachnia propionica TaxID=1750 RepID=UPI001C8B9F28